MVLGAGGAGLGGYLLWTANQEALNVACTRGTLSGQDCEGATRYPGESTRQLDDRASVVTQRRIGGGVALGLGVALVSVGLWQLLTPEQEATSARAVWGVTPLAGGGHVSFGLSF